MSSILRTTNLSIGYGKKVIAKDINIELETGKITTIIGPNGSGKSTLLKTLSGLLPAIGGDIILDDKKLADMKDVDKARCISVMMTGRNDTEFMSCEEVVALGRYPYTGRLGVLSKEDYEHIDEAMELVGVSELRDRDFMKLSDGQRQRVLLARAICQKPKLLIMDEPTTFLDISYKLELLAILKQLVVDKKLTVLMSVHDIELAKRVADKVICVNDSNCDMMDTDKVFTDEFIMKLYNVNRSHFDSIYKGDRLI